MLLSAKVCEEKGTEIFPGMPIWEQLAPQRLLLEEASYHHAEEGTYYLDYFDWNILVLRNTHT